MEANNKKPNLKLVKNTETDVDISKRAQAHMELLELYMQQSGVKFNLADNTFWWPSAKGWHPERDFAASLTMAQPKGSPLKSIRTSQAIIRDYIVLQHALEKEKVINKLKIVDVEKGTAEIVRALSILQQKPIEEVFDLDVYAIKSVLWQIKRKMFGFYDVSYPLMLILYGKGQGTGKSKFIEKLTNCVKISRSGNISIKSLSSSFNWDVFHKYHVLRFEEVNFKVRNFDHNDFKDILTASEHTMSPKNMHESTFNVTATCFGTSNEAPSEFLANDTGQRRFWAIEVPNVQVLGDRESQLESIDHDLMWEAVDGESALNPRAPVSQRMNEYQHEEYTHVNEKDSAIAEIFAQCFKQTDDLSEEIPQTVAWPYITRWCKENNYTVPTRDAVQKWLKNQTPPRFKKNNSNYSYLGYLLFK